MSVECPYQGLSNPTITKTQGKFLGIEFLISIQHCLFSYTFMKTRGNIFREL